MSQTKVEMRHVVCVEFFIFGGSLLGRIQGDREPVSLLDGFLQASRLYGIYFDKKIQLS